MDRIEVGLIEIPKFHPAKVRQRNGVASRILNGLHRSVGGGVRIRIECAAVRRLSARTSGFDLPIRFCNGLIAIAQLDLDRQHFVCGDISCEKAIHIEGRIVGQHIPGLRKDLSMYTAGTMRSATSR